MAYSVSYPRPATWVLAVALVSIGVLHAYWTMGGSWGLAGSLGRDHVNPSQVLRAEAAGVAAALLIAGAGVLARAGYWEAPLPWALVRWGTWVLAAALALAAVINLVARTRLERVVFAPFAGLLALMAAALAASPRP